MMSALRSVFVLLAALLTLPIAVSAAAQSLPPNDAPVSKSGAEEFVLDVRVHLLSSTDPSLNSRLTEDEVREAFRRVNEIWRAAGIRWRIESIVRQAMVDVGPSPVATQRPGPAGGLLGRLPRDQVTDHLWHVFFVREIGAAPGVYVTNLPAVIQSEVDPWGAAGLEGELVRVLAHELGHSLRLGHVECVAEGNLMSAGCDSANRTRLSGVQIEVAREQAASGRPFAGSAPLPAFVAYLTEQADALHLSAEQHRALQEVADAHSAEVEPLHQHRRALNEEGIRAMRSGGPPDPSAMQERQTRMREIAAGVQAAERRAVDAVMDLLDEDQRATASRLLERRAVMMGAQ